MYTGTLIEDLMQEVELKLALEAIEAPKPAWEILANARAYLAYSLTDENSKCAPDINDRITAYFTLAKLQEQIMAWDKFHGVYEESGADIRRKQGISDFAHDSYVTGGQWNG